MTLCHHAYDFPWFEEKCGQAYIGWSSYLQWKGDVFIKWLWLQTWMLLWGGSILTESNIQMDISLHTFILSKSESLLFISLIGVILGMVTLQSYLFLQFVWRPISASDCFPFNASYLHWILAAFICKSAWPCMSWLGNMCKQEVPCKWC